MKPRSIETKKTMLPWLSKKRGKCLNSSGSMIGSRGPLGKSSASGGASLAVASSCRERSTKMSISNPNSSMKQPRLSKSTIADITPESMSMISTQENLTCSTYKPKMMKSESSWKGTQGRQH